MALRWSFGYVDILTFFAPIIDEQITHTLTFNQSYQGTVEFPRNKNQLILKQTIGMQLIRDFEIIQTDVSEELFVAYAQVNHQHVKTFNYQQSFIINQLIIKNENRNLAFSQFFNVIDNIITQLPIYVSVNHFLSFSHQSLRNSDDLIIQTKNERLLLPIPENSLFEPTIKADNFSIITKITLFIRVTSTQRLEVQRFFKKNRNLEFTINDWTGVIWKAWLTDYYGNRQASYEFYNPNEQFVKLQFDAIKVGII